MTLNNQRKLSKHICRLLKVSEITYPIGRTPNGNLGITFNANNGDWHVMLDSIPLSTANSLEDENNIELKAMIEKYCFEPENVMTMSYKPDNIDILFARAIDPVEPSEVSPAKSEAPEKKVTKTKK